MIEQQGRLLGAEFHGLRNEQLLNVQRPLAHACLDLLEEDALVQRVLIDDEHAVGRLDDQIRVVHLNGVQHFRQFRLRRVRSPWSVVRGKELLCGLCRFLRNADVATR